mgnify:CR=1 FL=1
MSSSFGFFDSLSNFIDGVGGFLFGDDKSLGGTEPKDRGGLGFLADKFLEGATQDSEDRRRTRPTIDVPNLTGATPGRRAKVQATPQGQSFVGRNNPALQSALQRAVSGGLSNGQYANLWRAYASQPNKRSGQRTMGVEAARVQGATVAKPASVRTIKEA